MHDPIFFSKMRQIKPLPAAHNLFSPSAAESWARFQKNFRFATALADIPGYSFYMAGQWAQAGTNAAGKLNVLYAGENARIAKANQIGALAEKYMSQFITSHLASQTENVRMGTVMMEKFILEERNKDMRDVLDNMIRSIVIHSWSAIEVFFGHLCVGVRDKHPVCWAGPLQKRLNFKSRQSYLDAYNHVFSDTPINDILLSDDVRALGAIRHVLVHRTGEMDDPFLSDVRETKKLQGLFPAAHFSKSIGMDGRWAASLIDDGANACFLLLNAVDQWLKAKTP